MKEELRNKIFVIIGLSLALIVAELIFEWRYLSGVGLGLIIASLSLIVKQPLLNNLLKYLALFLILISLIALRSFYVFALVVLVFYYLFRTSEGNEFFDVQETIILPRGSSKAAYQSVELIQPQHQSRILVQELSLQGLSSEDQQSLEWDDVNLTYLGGNNIIDFGNHTIPPRETTIVLQKIYGRTRIILPKNVGLRINFSTISGNLIFEANQYHMLGKNFRWESPGYHQELARMNVILTVAFGDVEVILI